MKTALASIGLVVSVASFGIAQEAKPATPGSPAAGVVEVRDTEAIHALILPMKGSYMQHGEAFSRLMTELGTLGLMPTGPVFGRYLDSPEEVAEPNLTWEVGIPVGASAKAAPPFEIKDIPGGTSAVLVNVGPWDSAGPAWGTLIQWVFANGYQPTGAAIQVYHGDPNSSGASGPRTELRLPVTK